MKIHGTHSIQASRDRIFAALIDPQILQRCIPGCESLAQTAADTYVATMKAGVGAIKGTFKGTVRLEDLRPPVHYQMIVEGKMKSWFADNVLEEQPFVKDDTKTVGQLLQAAGLKVVRFVRYRVGELS